jgi:CRISPR-associated endonuclease Csn1
MKKILGLDLGTTSIGWALVNEAEAKEEKSSIIKIGVRVIPLSTDEESDFQKGKAISINADRTLKRGARRNLDRYQQRRDALVNILKSNNLISDTTILSEDGKQTTFATYEKRAKAPYEKIDKESLAKVFLMINKKRGYKSSRKAQSDDEGSAIDGMEVAKYIYDNNLTPGEYVYELLKNGKKIIPEFYRSDLQGELDRIWNNQKQYHQNVLTESLKEEIHGKGKKQTWAILKEPFDLVGVKRETKGAEQKKENFSWRVKALSEMLSLEELAIVLQEINNSISSSSGYLGAISDRSKELYFKKQTVGEYLYKQLEINPHTKLKNQVFYRQDYLDEFEAIWEKQKEFHAELTENLKKEIRDVIIFYQRRLKSQKHLISECEFEKYHKVVPKSSPLFQEFKIWQFINNIELQNIHTKEKFRGEQISQEAKENLFEELNIREKLTANEVLKLLVEKPKDFKLNYKEGLDGNRTNAEFYKVYQEILKREGVEYDFKKNTHIDINDKIISIFSELGVEQEIILFNDEKLGDEFDKQPMLQLWHLLYSFEGDNSRSGDKKLVNAIIEKFGFKREYAKLLANCSLQADYGGLSSKAIRKILPFLKEGNTYDKACNYAGYNHSSSLTKEEQDKRKLKEVMELLPKNSLRNPVVEKILNQLVNVVNAIIKDEGLGKPDEIRVELARELKKSAKERADMTSNINKATAKHEKIKKVLQAEFGITKVTRNDIIRFKLWEELESNGYKTIYTNTYIPRERIFSKEFDIEHIVPKALVFDDSFSNKTLAVREVNLKKSNETAYDFLSSFLDEAGFNQFLSRVEKMYKDGAISKAKYSKLLKKASELSEGFIERDLRNSQYKESNSNATRSSTNCKHYNRKYYR